jgi:ubiquinone/menaquinone biosynthesis C-methylase UbiE
VRFNTPAEISPIQYDGYVEQATKPWNDLLIKNIINEITKTKLQQGNILDVGTGTARTIINMASNNIFEKFSFEGLDYFQDMVNAALKNVNEAGLLRRIKITLGDVHQMDFADQSFDVVIGRSVIHHWTDPEKAYQEIYRVLKNDGIAIIHEPSRDPEKKALNVFNNHRRKFGIHDINLLEKYTVTEILDQLERAGLKSKCEVTSGKGIAGIGFELIIRKFKGNYNVL